MSLKKQFSKLRKSEDLQPDEAWKNQTKYELLSEISSQNRLMQAQKLTTSEKVDMLAMNFFNKVAPSFSKMVAGFLIVIMGSGVNMAAQASVPGQALWPVKRSIERAELTLTFSPVKETEIHIKHVNKRLDEIGKILESTENEIEPTETTKKERAIKQAVSHLEQDIKSADNSLKVVKEEKTPLEVVELAKKVTDATKEAVEDLEEKAVDLEDMAIEEVLDDAKVTQQEVNDAAVSLALEVHEEVVAAIEANKVVAENIDITTTTVPEILEIEDVVAEAEANAVKAVVAEMIAVEIMETGVEIEDINVKAGDAADAEAVEINLEGNEETIEDIEDVKKTSEESGVVLDEAKVLLEEGSLKDALEKVSESKEINEKNEVTLEQIEEQNEQVVNEGVETPVDEDLDNTTSSPEIIENTEDIEEPGSDLEMTTDEEVIKEEDVEMVDPKDLIYDHQLY
ncbi:hypothetical protein HOB10_03155 [Candidatus Parcubacteria bacterium]|jgi:hypothetical protein|nr:hypothetical protein [Candidatus Parcubacteria bacterium]